MTLSAVGGGGPPSVPRDVCVCKRQWDYSRVKQKLSGLYDSVFIETVSLQNVLELPKYLVLVFISTQTDKPKCQFWQYCEVWTSNTFFPSILFGKFHIKALTSLYFVWNIMSVFLKKKKKNKPNEKAPLQSARMVLQMQKCICPSLYQISEKMHSCLELVCWFDHRSKVQTTLRMAGAKAGFYHFAPIRWPMQTGEFV